MPGTDTIDRIETEAPTVPGWYRTVESGNYLIYMLNGNGDWYAITMSGDMTKCAWGYIDQAGSIELMAAGHA